MIVCGQGDGNAVRIKGNPGLDEFMPLVIRLQAAAQPESAGRLVPGLCLSLNVVDKETCGGRPVNFYPELGVLVFDL